MVHAGSCAYPACGGSLRRIGEDVTESLDYVPGRFRPERTVSGCCGRGDAGPAPR
ncbi:IS66 family transposase zinc-finger binding domain-containing protein [Methylobacterium indicum]|uniref:IS66 family transposase zinc-finger binding domain-containing protein n=1 Tax=Methylobacterium indicum TaxID=1775910 RepID=UPI003CC7D26D